jgi:hypothetical protein
MRQGLPRFLSNPRFATSPLSEIVVLPVAPQERVGAAAAMKMTNGWRRQRVLMSDYP